MPSRQVPGCLVVVRRLHGDGFWWLVRVVEAQAARENEEKCGDGLLRSTPNSDGRVGPCGPRLSAWLIAAAAIGMEGKGGQAPHRWNHQSLPVFHPCPAPAESSSTPPINVPIVRRQPESMVVRLRLSRIHPLAVAGPHAWGLTVPRTWPWVNHGG